MLALPPGGTIAVGDWGRRDDRSDALASRSLTNPQVWTEVTHVTVSSTPVARFDGTMDTLMDHEVSVWTTEAPMIAADRPGGGQLGCCSARRSCPPACWPALPWPRPPTRPL